MALKASQKSIIRLEISKGTSMRETAKIAQCSDKAVRTLVKKEKLEKDALQNIAKEEVANLIIEDELKTRKRRVSKKKDALERTQLEEYETVLEDTKLTHRIATNFQSIIELRQTADADAIETLILMKAKQLKEAGDDLEERFRIEMKFRDYLAVITDYDEVKKGVEANDKASITKGEAPRFATKNDTTVNNLTLIDSDESFKGMF